MVVWFNSQSLSPHIARQHSLLIGSGRLGERYVLWEHAVECFHGFFQFSKTFRTVSINRNTESMFSISFRKHHKEKESNLLTLIIKMEILFSLDFPYASIETRVLTNQRAYFLRTVSFLITRPWLLLMCWPILYFCASFMHWCFFISFNKPSLKDVRANCFCASLLRTQIHMSRHASSARAKY